MAARFRVLSDALRLRLLQALMAGERTVSELVSVTDASQPTVSKHLSVLREEGLVAGRRDGNRVLYSVVDPSVFQLCELVCGSLESKARADLARVQGIKFAG